MYLLAAVDGYPPVDGFVEQKHLRRCLIRIRNTDLSAVTFTSGMGANVCSTIKKRPIAPQRHTERLERITPVGGCLLHQIGQ